MSAPGRYGLEVRRETNANEFGIRECSSGERNLRGRGERGGRNEESSSAKHKYIRSARRSADSPIAQARNYINHPLVPAIFNVSNRLPDALLRPQRFSYSEGSTRIIGTDPAKSPWELGTTVDLLFISQRFTQYSPP